MDRYGQGDYNFHGMANPIILPIYAAMSSFKAIYMVYLHLVLVLVCTHP